MHKDNSLRYNSSGEVINPSDCVKVVRCKDCQKCEWDGFDYVCKNHPFYTLRTDLDDFCSHGIRK